jgi:hydrogenase expression/formation protein HypE
MVPDINGADAELPVHDEESPGGLRDAERVPLPTGKLPASLISRLLADFGPVPPEVLLGPALGEDAGAIEVPGSVLVVATDPITLTGRGIGHLAVTVNANDVAVSGATPRWFLVAVLLPPGTNEEAVESLFGEIRTSLTEGGIALVGGHTEITEAVNQPVVIGQMLGLAHEGRVVKTGGVQKGDVVIQVGRAPVEGAAVLAAEGGPLLDAVDSDHLRAAEGALRSPGISVVAAALLAARLGTTAMHDPTEGGLAAGLHEMAAASGARLEVDRDRVLWWEPAIALCRALAADPWAILASGTLLAAFDPSTSTRAIDAFGAAGLEAAAIAKAGDGTGVFDTSGEPIPWPECDEITRLFRERLQGPAG